MTEREIISLKSVIDCLEHFADKAKLFPLTFTKLSGSNKSRKYAIGTIMIPKDIADADTRPITRDWTYMCFALPKEEFEKYMKSGELK